MLYYIICHVILYYIILYIYIYSFFQFFVKRVSRRDSATVNRSPQQATRNGIIRCEASHLITRKLLYDFIDTFGTPAQLVNRIVYSQYAQRHGISVY